MSGKLFDLVITGAGPCGIAAAAEAAKNDLEYVVLEKGSLAESIRNYPNKMTFFSTADNISVGGVPFTIDEPKATREQALSYYRKVVEFHNLDIACMIKLCRLKKREMSSLLRRREKMNTGQKM